MLHDIYLILWASLYRWWHNTYQLTVHIKLFIELHNASSCVIQRLLFYTERSDWRWRSSSFYIHRNITCNYFFYKSITLHFPGCLMYKKFFFPSPTSIFPIEILMGFYVLQNLVFTLTLSIFCYTILYICINCRVRITYYVWRNWKESVFDLSRLTRFSFFRVCISCFEYFQIS